MDEFIFLYFHADFVSQAYLSFSAQGTFYLNMNIGKYEFYLIMNIGKYEFYLNMNIGKYEFYLNMNMGKYEFS
jgi:hypothetical protein